MQPSRFVPLGDLLLLVAAVASAFNAHAGPAVINVFEGVEIILGEQETLLKDGELGLRFMPDLGVGVVESEPGRLRLLFAAGFATYLVEGSDIKNLRSAHKVLSPGGPGEFDNGDAAVSQVVRAKDNLYAIYHAEDHEGLPPIQEGGLPGYYASVGLAESDGAGNTWTKRGQIIKGAKPKEWTAYAGHSARGTGLPGAVSDPTGRYLYVYYTDQSMQDRRGAQICMARADLKDGPPFPGAWKKFYNGDFTEPGIGGAETPVVNVLNVDAAHALYPHVTYSHYLKMYVMVFNLNRWKEALKGVPLTKSGIYLSLSSDGVHWSTPVMLVTDYSFPMLGKSVSMEATVVFDNKEERAGWLLYAYSPKWTNGKAAGIPHYMVGRRLEFHRAG